MVKIWLKSWQKNRNFWHFFFQNWILFPKNGTFFFQKSKFFMKKCPKFDQKKWQNFRTKIGHFPPFGIFSPTKSLNFTLFRSKLIKIRKNWKIFQNHKNLYLMIFQANFSRFFQLILFCGFFRCENFKRFLSVGFFISKEFKILGKRPKRPWNLYFFKNTPAPDFLGFLL